MGVGEGREGIAIGIELGTFELLDGGFDERIVDVEVRVAGGIAGLEDGGDAEGVEPGAIGVGDEAVEILELVFIEIG